MAADSLSLRDVEELLDERGLQADQQILARRRNLRSRAGCYLYFAIDSAGATIDFLLSALRDVDAAKRLFRKALSDQSHPQPRVINTDLAPFTALPAQICGFLTVRPAHPLLTAFVDSVWPVAFVGSANNSLSLGHN